VRLVGVQDFERSGDQLDGADEHGQHEQLQLVLGGDAG
jgi:hypothetical protein